MEIITSKIIETKLIYDFKFVSNLRKNYDKINKLFDIILVFNQLSKINK